MVRSEHPAATPELAARGAREARWWRTERDGRILCALCPRLCRLAAGQAGFCFIRQNLGGRLMTLGYGRLSALCADPIEKKPLFHFLPGTQVLSMGTAGCNMACKFCQNWDLSRAHADQVRARELPPDRIVDVARAEGCASVAFTYNEPTIFAEHVLDTARACRRAGIGTIMVTNGYIGREAQDDVYPFIDAANVDLKAYTEDFYRRQTLSELAPVLAALVRMKELGTWIEITTLVIPGLNDRDDELAAECDWILEHLGDEVPLHLSAFHPDYQLAHLEPTPRATLVRARALARARGLKFVYCGNIRDSESHATRCPACGEDLIRREWHAVTKNRLVGSGQCACGRRIPGMFDARSRERSSGDRRSLMGR